METEKRRTFIIHFLYFGILLTLAFILLKYGMPMLAPFVTAFVIAYLLKKPIRFLANRLPLSRKVCAILVVLLFYSTIGLLLVLLSVRLLAGMEDLLRDLPAFYAARIEPALTDIFDSAEQSVLLMDPSLIAALEEVGSQFVQAVGKLVSDLSVGAMGVVSGMASSLPGLFIKLILMIISTFFIAIDYDHLTGFCLMQLSGKAKDVFLQIKEYVVGTLFVCIRSYLLIMSITFVELSVGLSVIGVDNAVIIALIIAIFDILPVLGTGGIMIPWAVITLLQGNYPLALALALVYLIITVIRNIIEPKIVGSQIGLHPVITLASMFVGAQLFGVLGLFGFPIGLSLLRHLNDNGTIHLFKNPQDLQPVRKKASGEAEHG